MSSFFISQEPAVAGAPLPNKDLGRGRNVDGMGMHLFASGFEGFLDVFMRKYYSELKLQYDKSRGLRVLLTLSARLDGGTISSCIQFLTALIGAYTF